jgi:uncharacterized protein (DUF58 family)
METPAYMRLLPAESLATLSRLELLARGVVSGFVSGKHRSPHKGFSVEFAEHRQYVPGDDLRNLDWRVLARKDRYYIKQYIEETNLRATLVVDASGSMGYAGDQAAKTNGEITSKFAYAQYLAASLTYLMIGQADAVGAVTFDTDIRAYHPARSRASQVRLILEELNRTEPGGETGLSEVLHTVAERIPRRGLVIILSDMFDDIEALMKALHHFRYRNHEVLVMHIMAEEELRFPFDSFTNFEDLEESEDALALDPKTIRASYLARVRRFLSELQAGCGQLEIDYVPLNTKEPFDRALSEYLSRRRA